MTLTSLLGGERGKRAESQCWGVLEGGRPGVESCLQGRKPFSSNALLLCSGLKVSYHCRWNVISSPIIGPFAFGNVCPLITQLQDLLWGLRFVSLLF